MRDKMETDESRRIYRFRKITVEPVIGQIKENFGFRQFGLWGLEGAKIEINIVAIVHNLKKIWRMKEERKKILEMEKKFARKSFDLEVFVEVYFFAKILIVGQRPLL
jgi:transposase